MAGGDELNAPTHKGKRGVRLTLVQDEQSRAAIQTTHIVKRLMGLVKGEVEMPPHAVTAALGLLKKRLPDLSAVDHSGSIEMARIVEVPTLASSTEGWEKTHVPQHLQ